MTLDGDEACEQRAYVVDDTMLFRIEHVCRWKDDGWNDDMGWEIFSDEEIVHNSQTESEARAWVEQTAQAGKGGQ